MENIDIKLTSLLQKGDNKQAGKIIDRCASKIREYYNQGNIDADTFFNYEIKVNQIRKSLDEIYFPLSKEQPMQPINKAESIFNDLMTIANRLDQNSRVINEVQVLIKSFQDKKISKGQLLMRVKNKMQQWQRSR